LKTESELAAEDQEHRAADIIVVPSRFVAQTLVENGVPVKKIRINRFGTDLMQFHPSGTSKRTSPLIFLFVGAHTARKGLPLLLKAWKKISPRDAELWIVGKGQLPEKARHTADNRIRWLGSVSRQQLPKIFQSAHVFVCPSFFEGLAQVQVEAAACGLPIITTTAAGGDEIIENGRTGVLLDAGNVDQLSEAISRFIECPKLIYSMSEEVRKQLSRLSWSEYGTRWQRILQELL
jgi:glycosyltransferase involved in cell wall biosynthesis